MKMEHLSVVFCKGYSVFGICPIQFAKKKKVFRRLVRQSSSGSQKILSKLIGVFHFVCLVVWPSSIS